MIFSKKLKELRNQAGWSQEQLAERLDISRQAVAKWEAGAGLPDIDNLQKIASVFNVSLDTLLDYRQATTLAAVRESIDLKSFPKSEKGHSLHDSAVRAKYPGAVVTQLQKTKKLTWWQQIVDTFVFSSGTMDVTYALAGMKEVDYLAEKGDRQWLVNVSDTDIESRELVKPFAGKGMVIDGFKYEKLKRFVG